MSDSFHWPGGPDPFKFLESLDSRRARAWVDEQNARTHAALRHDEAFGTALWRCCTNQA
ncbi:MAG: hypothetical protein VB143_06905 [Burkholderia sp.]